MVIRFFVEVYSVNVENFLVIEMLEKKIYKVYGV